MLANFEDLISTKIGNKLSSKGSLAIYTWLGLWCITAVRNILTLGFLGKMS